MRGAFHQRKHCQLGKSLEPQNGSGGSQVQNVKKWGIFTTPGGITGWYLLVPRMDDTTNMGPNNAEVTQVYQHAMDDTHFHYLFCVWSARKAA